MRVRCSPLTPATSTRNNSPDVISTGNLAPQPRHAHRRAELPRYCILLAGGLERTLETRLRFGRIRHRWQQSDFAGRAIDLGLVPTFLGCFHRGHRIANTGPDIIELTEFRISFRQT